MAEELPMPDGTAAGHDAVRFSESIAEAKAKLESPADAVSPESLGVDQASFDKYHKEGNFDWQSYAKELEFKQTQKGQAPDEPKKATDAPQHSDNVEAADKVAEAGLDWNELGAQITSTGTIADADFAALQAIGVPQEVVDNYINMVKGQSQDMIDSVITGFGGQEQFNQVFDALQELPVEKRDALDVLIMDPSTRAAGVAASYAAAGITPPGNAPAPAPVVRNGAQNQASAPASSSNSGYGSWEEQVQAQRDPRYKRDVAYRNEVMERIGRTDFGSNPRTHTGGL
jgi:hypothetical protein